MQPLSSKGLNAVNRAIYIYTLDFFNKNNNNWPLHCVSRINSNPQMATIYLVFLKNKNTYIKMRIKLFVKEQDIFNLKFKGIA